MRVGLIARAENIGLGAQTWEFFRHIRPAKTLVVNLAARKGRTLYPDRFPGAAITTGFPSAAAFRTFLRDLDVVFSCETFYGDLVPLAEAAGVKTVLQYNYEFLDHLRHPELPRPTLFAAPSLWHYADVPFGNKVFLPVPIATDRFPERLPARTATRFLHIVGRPAVHDRNGTPDLLDALQFVQQAITVTITCQDPNYVPRLLRAYTIPEQVDIVVESGNPANYWDLYADADILVMPRRFGGLSLPAQEAIGAGMPVIMPAISPNDTWLPPEWLVPATRTGRFEARTTIDLYSTDPGALAIKIDQCASDHQFYADAADKARALAKRMSWDNLRPEYEQVFEGLG